VPTGNGIGSPASQRRRASRYALDSSRPRRAIVLDEPIELFEGAGVEVSLPDPDELTLVDRAELEAAVEENTAQFERGERQC
jgi:hypothetical protein